jgi:hypothetical protein
MHESLPGVPDILLSTTMHMYFLCSHWLSGSTGQLPWPWGLGLSTTWGQHAAAAEEVEARPAEEPARYCNTALFQPPLPEPRLQVSKHVAL